MFGSCVVKVETKAALEVLDSNLNMPSLYPAQVKGVICKQGLWCLMQNKCSAQLLNIYLLKLSENQCFHAVSSERFVLETSYLFVCYASSVLKWHVPPHEVAVLMHKTLPVAMKCAPLMHLISTFSETFFYNLLFVLFHFNLSTVFYRTLLGFSAFPVFRFLY